MRVKQKDNKKMYFPQYYLLLMERLSNICKPVAQKTPGNQREANEKIQDERLRPTQETTDEGEVGMNNHIICIILVSVLHTRDWREGVQSCYLPLPAPQQQQTRKCRPERHWTGGTSGNRVFTTRWERSLFISLVMTSASASQ